MDVRNWAVLGSAAAAVVAGVYVLWGPSERRRKSRRGESVITPLDVIMTSHDRWHGHV